MVREDKYRYQKYFELYKMDNVMADLITQPSTYPVYSNDDVELSQFTTVTEAKLPVILNRSQAVISEALTHMNASIMPGMSQDSNLEAIDGCDYDCINETCVRVTEHETNPIPIVESNFFDHLQTYIKDI